MRHQGGGGAVSVAIVALVLRVCLLWCCSGFPAPSIAKTVCTKADIEARRSTTGHQYGLSIDARKWVACDEVDLSILTSADAGNKLLAEGAEELGRYLGVSKRLRRLKLAGNFIGDEGAAHIANGLRSNSVLESLWLGRNNITATGLADISAALQSSTAPGFVHGNQQLRELKLEFNSIANVDALCDALDPGKLISEMFCPDVPVVDALVL